MYILCKYELDSILKLILLFKVCELYVAGYKFQVLDDVFVIHKGFKVPGDFHETKNLEQEKNRRLFRIFKQELKRKYPRSTRRC